MSIPNQFDDCYTTNELQKLKILLSFMDSPIKPALTVYIKWKELELSLQAVGHGKSVQPREASENRILQILTELLPYCSAEEGEQIRQIRNTMETAENLKNTMEYVQMLREMMGEEGSGEMDLQSVMEMMNGLGDIRPGDGAGKERRGSDEGAGDSRMDAG